MYFYLKQGVAETDQKEVFVAAAPPGNSFVIRETQLLFTLLSPIFSEASCLKIHPPHTPRISRVYLCKS